MRKGYHDDLDFCKVREFNCPKGARFQVSSSRFQVNQSERCLKLNFLLGGVAKQLRFPVQQDPKEKCQLFKDLPI